MTSPIREHNIGTRNSFAVTVMDMFRYSADYDELRNFAGVVSPPLRLYAFYCVFFYFFLFLSYFTVK